MLNLVWDLSDLGESIVAGRAMIVVSIVVVVCKSENTQAFFVQMEQRVLRA